TRRTPTTTLFPYTTLFRSYELSDVYNDVLMLQEKKELYDSISKGYERLILASETMLATGAISKNEQLRVKAEKLTIDATSAMVRSEEHTSELQSREKLVCR